MRNSKKQKRRTPVPKGWHTLKSGIIRRGHWYIGKWRIGWCLTTSSKNKVAKLQQYGPFKSVAECKAERLRIIRKVARG